jgi:fatty acid synthase
LWIQLVFNLNFDYFDSFVRQVSSRRAIIKMAANQPLHRFDEPNFQHSRWLSSAPGGEEVVISGMSGRLPDSRTIHEFRDNLFTKTEMVNGDDRRWKLDHPEVPQRSAKIRNIDQLDAGYFGVHPRQADNMDPMIRIVLETALEAIMDAGMNPSELEGSRTGVFAGACWSDMENKLLMSATEPQKFPLTGYVSTAVLPVLSRCVLGTCGL